MYNVYWDTCYIGKCIRLHVTRLCVREPHALLRRSGSLREDDLFKRFKSQNKVASNQKGKGW